MFHSTSVRRAIHHLGDRCLSLVAGDGYLLKLNPNNFINGAEMHTKFIQGVFRRFTSTFAGLPLRVAGAASLLIVAGCQPTERVIDWDAVRNGEHRAEANKARDVYRHPKETLSFFGVTPCSTVVEIWPGGKGWYTEILGPILKDCGKLYAAHFNPESEVEYFRKSLESYKTKLAASPGVYRTVELTVLDAPEKTAIAPEGSADFVLTFRNIHNWMKYGTDQAVFAAAYKALKPGGILGVVEHRADAGVPLSTMISSGYVTEAKAIELAEAAGFKLVEKSDVNANPKDGHFHPRGVWTLPPSLRMGDEDREKYLAIGESDRFTMTFRKPGK